MFSLFPVLSDLDFFSLFLLLMFEDHSLKLYLVLAMLGADSVAFMLLIRDILDAFGKLDTVCTWFDNKFIPIKRSQYAKTKNGDKIHKLGCLYIKNSKDLVYFKNIEETLDKGYTQCRCMKF